MSRTILKNNKLNYLVITVSLILMLLALTMELKLVYDYYVGISGGVDKTENKPVIDRQGFNRILEKIK